MAAIAMFDAFDPRVEPTWRDLEARARPPYTSSWGWIETWRACLPRRDAPRLVVLAEDGAPQLASFERMPALCATAFPALGVATTEYRVVAGAETTLPHVDLDTVRGVAGGYPAMLPASARAQLDHARRDHGELAVERALDLGDACAVLDELLVFAGVHDDPFHRRLVERRFGHGEIELQRIRARTATLGCVLLVHWRGRAIAARAAYAKPAHALAVHAATIAELARGTAAFYELPAAAALATGGSRHTPLYLVRTRQLATRLMRAAAGWRRHMPSHP